MQTGDTVRTPVKRRPCAAIPSIAGVRITECPAQPSESARAWSSITMRTCGLVWVVSGALPWLAPAA